MAQVSSVLILLLPAVFSWWQGRRLLRRLEDPAFPELHFARAKQGGLAAGICIGVSIILTTEHAGPKLLLGFFSLAAGDYAYRKALFKESWSFLAYLGHVVRLSLALYGVWILLGLLPELLRLAGGAAVPVAIVLAIVVVAWSHGSAWVLEALTGARVLDHPALGRFIPVVQKASCRPPRVLRAGPPGGFWLNAFAVPSLYRPAVVLSDNLLEALGPREITAVFAHEVAHLEHYHRRRMWLAQLRDWTLLALVLTLMLHLGPGSTAAAIVAWSWPLGCLLLISSLMSRRQAHEYQSDLRALALGAEPQALIDALTKVHLLTRMPRRWDAASETKLSHPSLARRIRAIRDAAAMPRQAAGGPAVMSEADPARAPELAVRAGDDSGRAVVWLEDRLYWLGGVAPGAPLDPRTLPQAAGDRRLLAYSELIDLRLEVRGLSRRVLKITDRRRQSMTMPLAPADVAAVKAVLERVDLQLLSTAPGEAPGVEGPSELWWARIEGVLAMLIAVLPPFSGPLVLTSLLVAVRPALASLAAAGAAALGGAILDLRQQDVRGLEGLLQGEGLAMLSLRALFGMVFFGMALRRAQHRLPEPRWMLPLTLVLVGGFAAASSFGILLRLGLPDLALQLHLWARRSTGLVLLLICFGAALWTVRGWQARLPAALAWTVAAVVLLAGSLGFRQHFSVDPLRSREPVLELETARLVKLRETTLDDYFFDLKLSPAGKLAGSFYDEDFEDYESEAEQGFRVELGGGGFLTVPALAGELLDATRLVLVISDGEEALALRTLTLLPTTEPELEVSLPLLVDPELRLGGEPGGWQVVGTDTEGSEVVSVSGRFGQPGALEVRHTLDGDEGSYLDTYLIDADGRMLTVTQTLPFGDGDLGAMLLFGLAGTWGTSEITLHEGAERRVLGRTGLQLRCFSPAAAQRGFLCASSDEEATQLWSVDSEGFVPIGSLAGDYYESLVAADGRVLLTGFGDEPMVIVDPTAARAVRVEPPPPVDDATPVDDAAGGTLLEAMLEDFWSAGEEPVAFAHGLLAFSGYSEEEVRITVYRLGGSGEPDGPAAE